MKNKQLLLVALNWLLISRSHGNCPTYSLTPEYLTPATPAYLIFNQYSSRQKSMPANFRVIKDYQILASAQFTLKQFQNATLTTPGIIDVDLRSEYHGFINAMPVSFKTLPDNNINASKSQDLIIKHEHYLFNRTLRALPYTSIYSENLKAPPTANSVQRCTPTANSMTESQAMAELNNTYYRISELDHLQPSMANLDALVRLYDTRLKSNPKQWVYLHCQGGAGRTTTAIAALIMLKQQDSTQKLDTLANIIMYAQNHSHGYQLQCKRIKIL